LLALVVPLYNRCEFIRTTGFIDIFVQVNSNLHTDGANVIDE